MFPIHIKLICQRCCVCAQNHTRSVVCLLHSMFVYVIVDVICRFIELDEGETVESVTQQDIVQAVDITSAQKVRHSV